ncbi:MAG: DMT family transporter [Acidimicrobiales bacterium]
MTGLVRARRPGGLGGRPPRAGEAIGGGTSRAGEATGGVATGGVARGEATGGVATGGGTSRAGDWSRAGTARRLPWGHLLVMAVILNVGPFLLYAWGEEHVASGLAGMFNATTPLFTVLVALAALPEERLSRGRAGGLLIGLAGVVVVLAPWRPGSSVATVTGELACLGAAASYGIGFVYTRRFVAGRGIPPLRLATAQLVLATVVLGVLAPLVATGPVHLTATVVPAVAVLGAVNTGVGYLLYHFLVREAGATRASTVTYLVPVVAVALGVIVRGEALTWTIVVGGLVVIFGLVVLEGRLAGRLPAGRRRRRPAPSPGPQAGAPATLGSQSGRPAS